MKHGESARNLVLEAVVIVASILLAFGIQAAWDVGRESARLGALERDLAEDFRATRLQALASADAVAILLERDRKFLEATGRLESVSVDSLQTLFDAAYRTVSFNPSIPALRSALENGDLAALRNPELTEAVTQFETLLQVLEELTAVQQAFSDGGRLSQLAEEVGSVYVLIGPTALGSAPERFELSDAEYRAFIAEPRVYATVEHAMIAHSNIESSLRQIDAVLGGALAALASR